jgi:kumamolisin
MKNRHFRLDTHSTPKVLLSLSVTALLAACNSDSGPSYTDCTPAASAQSRLAAQLLASPMVQTMRGTESHIPKSVKNMADQGALDASQRIPVTIALALNNEDELNERISQMYQPGHPNYRKYMTQQEFSERYAPTTQQILEAQSFLAQHGIHATSVGPSGLTIHALAGVASLNEAFQTEIHQYQATSGADQTRTRYAPAYEPQMPAGLSIRAVHGLESPVALHHHAVANVTAQSGSGSGGGLTPANIHTAYNIPTSETGSGQTIALVELDGFTRSDITAYESAFGLGTTAVSTQLVDGATGTPGANADEVTLDIELSVAIAPGANIVVYEAPNNSQDLLTLYETIAASTSVNEVSISWGIAESDYTTSFMQTESGVFRQMAAVGMSVYAAAGDSGFEANGSSPSVEDPGTQPFVVAVGGTHLNIGAGGSYVSETVWDDSSTDATGGGVSQVWSIPTWQSGVNNAQNLASGSMRNVPDISLNADPDTGYSIYLNGGWTVYGGTSCASPLWSAFTAIVNEKRVASGLPALGFTNPYLYQLGSSSGAFHDIQSGSNGYYPAVPGFDDSTGWGSINGTTLYDDLTVEPKAAAASC